MKLTEALRAADRIGSCTAREVKELACSPGVRALYIWRSNTISMMSDPLPRQIDLDAAGLLGGGRCPGLCQSGAALWVGADPSLSGAVSADAGAGRL